MTPWTARSTIGDWDPLVLGQLTLEESLHNRVGLDVSIDAVAKPAVAVDGQTDRIQTLEENRVPLLRFVAGRVASLSQERPDFLGVHREEVHDLAPRDVQVGNLLVAGTFADQWIGDGVADNLVGGVDLVAEVVGGGTVVENDV